MNQSNTAQSGWIEAALARHEAPLVRYAASITGDEETARDVVQEAFIKLCAANRAKVENSLAPWLYKVVRNQALNQRRKEARMAPLLENAAATLDNGQPDPSDAAAQNETHALVAEALQKRPDNEQEACRLKFQNGRTYREISEIMGVSLGTVSSLIHRALDGVRQELKPQADLRQEG